MMLLRCCSSRHWLGKSFRSGSSPVPRAWWLAMLILASTPARSKCWLQMLSQRPRVRFISSARSALVNVSPGRSPQPFLQPPRSGFLALARLKNCSGSRSMPSRRRSENMI